MKSLHNDFDDIYIYIYIYICIYIYNVASGDPCSCSDV